MSRYDQDFAEQPTGGVEITARLKWFNVTKGFGFVSPVDGSADAFLHVSVLHRAGLQQINEQAELLCEVGQGAKGPQVTHIIQVLSEGNPAGGAGGMAPRNATQRKSDLAQDDYMPQARVAAAGPEEETTGVVKWYKADKGFGFITPDGSDKDVFVHKSVLQKAGLYGLETGQRVQMRIQEAQKGREATWIAPL